MIDFIKNVLKIADEFAAAAKYHMSGKVVRNCLFNEYIISYQF
jgi:hypothetical protein